MHRSSRVTAAGGLIGLAVAAGVMGLVWLNQDRSEILQAITNFFASLPTFIGLKLKLPQALLGVLFFIYWALVGGVFGLLMKLERRVWRLTTISLMVIFATLHWIADVKLTGDIEAAVRAVVEALIGAGR